MKLEYHAINKNVPMEVCTAEQKVAYNLASRIYKKNLPMWEELKREKKSVIVLDNYLTKWKRAEINQFKKVYNSELINLDAMCSALNAGLADYFKTEHKDFLSLEDMHKSIGEMFPAYYL